MNERSFWNYLPSAGSLVSLLLVGLVLLSGLVYYRAVKIQRFLEPALALSQPRNEFSKRIRLLFQKEFGSRAITGLGLKMGVIRVSPSLIFSADGSVRDSGRQILKKIARILASLMADAQARQEISLIVISGRVPVNAAGAARVTARMNAQFLVESIQDALFRAEPSLGARYAASFAAVTRFADQDDGNEDIDIRIIPSEFLHIKVLEKLEKYSY